MARTLLRTITNPRLLTIGLIYSVGLLALAVLFRLMGL
jgi:hypothetical protein